MCTSLSDKDFFLSKNQSIAIEPRIPQLPYPEHGHNFNEIVIVMKGTGKHILNDKGTTLYPGMFFYVNDKDRHAYEDVNDLHLTNILFKDESNFKFITGIHNLLPKSNDSNAYFFINPKSQLNITRTIRHFDQLINVNGSNQIEYETLFMQLLIVLNKNYYCETGTGDVGNRIKQILKWINLNYSQKINWEELAQKFSVSNRTLYRYMQKYFNITPQKYLTDIRLSEAHYQLKYTDKTIIDIALECGFSDNSYFSTCFKEKYGKTPSFHRKNFDVENFDEGIKS